MKGFRGTWIMMGVVALLVAVTLYEYKTAEDDEREAKGERRLFYLLRDDLEEIELTSKGHTTVVRKEGKDWKLVKPVEDLAEPSAVEGFVFSLLQQKGKEFQTDKQAKETKFAEFGLDPVVSTIKVRGKGKTETLDVSSKNTFDGQFYVRSNGETRVLVGDRALAQILEREPASFRSRRIYREEGEVKVIEAQIDAGVKDSYTLKRDKEQWVMTPDPGFPVDTVKANQWMQKVQGLMPTEVVSETLGEDEKAKFLLKKPSLHVKMDAWEVTLGQDLSEDVYLFTNKRSTVYKAQAAAADLIRVPKEYFRNGTIPFKFELEMVREIDVNFDKLKATFVKKESTWVLKTERKGEQLNADKLVNLIQSVQTLEAQEFLGAHKGGGFPAAPQIVMKDGAGKVIYSLAWGGEYKPKYAYNKGYTFRYVKTSASQEIIGLPKEKLDRLVDSGLIKK